MESTKKHINSSMPKPSGNTGTHQNGPNSYLLSQITRTNYITSRRNPFVDNPSNLATQLQRLVHYEGNRPPNRKILFHLRLLTYYPPVPDILPELIQLLESQNVHICRLAHYHIRQIAPIHDEDSYRILIETLEKEVLQISPARRAAATKTLAKVFKVNDISRATDFVLDVFNCIGGARAKNPDQIAPRKLGGMEIPGTNKNKAPKRDKKPLIDTSFLSKKVVAGDSYDEQSNPKKKQKDEEEHEQQSRRHAAYDDGAGGVLESTRANAPFIKSRFGKMLVGHTAFAALRRINRIATLRAKIPSYIFDSGLMSVVPSTVRHCIALLEWRSTVSPGPVSRYLVGRLPHKNPPPNKRLHLEELGARVYYARLLSALAEDPNLSAYIPDEAPKQAKRDNELKNQTLKEALNANTYKAKANGLFKFLFNKERVNQVTSSVRKTTANALTITRTPKLPRDDPLGVEFAEALINLLKNASNRVLIEALRGLSRRRWTTWFETPIPQGALYNSPELQDEEAYGGVADAWGVDDDDEGDSEDEDDENELGAYENDVTGDQDSSKGSLPGAMQNTIDPALDDLGSGDKETWFSRAKVRRKERRNARIDQNTPFYLRKVGQGMVPALEVILRRINAALLHDEPIRRFAAADAIIVLARGKIYGHSKEDHDTLRKAQSSVANTVRESASRSLVVASSAHALMSNNQGPGFHEERHPFQALVRPLAELIEEDPNQFVRGRAAVALMFVIASGAGRTVLEPDNFDLEVNADKIARHTKLQGIPLLLRYFKSLVTREDAGTGIGLKLISELIDYLVYEVLDVAPDLASSAVQMTELWAMTHPTVGVCGRLGAIWEKVLSIGQGEVVGKSIFRAGQSTPHTERVTSAAVIFLRRRTLDLSIITVGTAQLTGLALSEPLPRAIGVEMEKYFSLLWHAALLGPSAECRTFAVEALGGAAVLAGEPFRCSTYERLVELVRMRGFGLKIPAEHVLNCLDVLYYSRERFSEARANNRISRDGRNTSRKWLELVWKLAAEASAAAQILLGVAPPNGWQPLGPSGAADVSNAESQFGDVRARQGDQKGSEPASSLTAPAGNVQHLLLSDGASSQANHRRIGSGGVGGTPPQLSARAYSNNSFDGWQGSPRNSSPREYPDDVDEYSSRSPPSHHRRMQERSGHRSRRSRSASPIAFNLPRSRSDIGYEDSHSAPANRRNGSILPENIRKKREQQEKEDFELARRLQEEAALEEGSVRGNAKEMFSSAGDVAGKLLKQGMRGGAKLTAKAKLNTLRNNSMKRLDGAGSSHADRYG